MTEWLFIVVIPQKCGSLDERGDEGGKPYLQGTNSLTVSF